MEPVEAGLPYGLVVRIPAFHAGGPGSIPGVGTELLVLFTLTPEIIISQHVAPPVILDSIVVSIPACHAGDRGSIPRRGECHFFPFCRCPQKTFGSSTE